MTIPDKKLINEMTRVLQLEGQAILDCASRLNHKDQALQIQAALTYFQTALDQGGKIIVTGVGKSGKIAQKIAATLSSTGSLAVFLHPTEGLHGDIGVVQSKDAVLALSYTGNTDELVRLVPSLKSLGVKLIGLGGNSQSQLAQKCDAWIDASVSQEACPHNLAPTTSTTLALALGDALAVALMQLRGFDAKAFAQNHPGGSLGKRLNLTVSDLMHSGSSVPTLLETASVDEIVGAFTRQPLGGVLVILDQKLIGIITDGDLRRSLKHKTRFFDLKAADLMTRSPVVAKPGMMAQEALELMENRPQQISVLPVVDDSHHWLGMIRLHDIVRTF